MSLAYLYRGYYIHVILLEYLVYLVGEELLVLAVGYALDEISHALAHLLGKIVAEACLENIADTALARLAVDADNVGFVLSADVLGVDREIGHCPVLSMPLLAPFQTLGDSVLMRAAEGCEYQLSRIGLALVDIHSRNAGVELRNSGYIAELELRIDAL